VDPKDTDFSISEQCKMLDISRSGFYYKDRPKKQEGELILDSVSMIYSYRPYYGARRLKDELMDMFSIPVTRYKASELMKTLNLQAIYPKKNTSIPNIQHKKYKYRLKGLSITTPNMVWATDITYIKLKKKKGFAFLTVIFDLYSRYVVAYRLSLNMESEFCQDALNEALALHGAPKYFNSDQGSQFTDHTFTDILKAKKIIISMDGKGRAFDNIFVERFWRTIKYEDIYINGYETMEELEAGLKKYFYVYNFERRHSSLEGRTPAEMYLGVKILRQAC
jgi:putative transposase